MAITVTTSVDILDSKRTAIDPDTFQPLGAAAGFFDQGDAIFEIDVFQDGLAFDLTAIGIANLILVISRKTEPDAPSLVISSASAAGANTNQVVFTANTATVELQDYLQGKIEDLVDMALLDNTSPANPQVMANWTSRALNRSFNPNLSIPIYTNIQHKLSVNPDRQPLPSDDNTLGFSLGSIWLYHNLASPTDAEIWICRFAGTNAAIWDLIAPVTTVSGFQIIQVPFSFVTSSPLALLSVVTGDTIVNTSIDITESFDDGATDISVGTPANNDLLLDSGDNVPGTVGLYEDTKNTVFGSAQSVNLYINAGTSTQGEGIVTIYINRI